eukprot:TRINITY_DN21922_c0_g1_i2.p1 TRINITY_DN21922_c0_g1~~TRINITY_DN21922_c0_g1_i2.p1  ORF type:complete len:915 (+),score=277.00 TRINITY_DN21922_c0_g1_i2:131-2746(+)
MQTRSGDDPAHWICAECSFKAGHSLGTSISRMMNDFRQMERDKCDAEERAKEAERRRDRALATLSQERKDFIAVKQLVVWGRQVARDDASRWRLVCRQDQERAKKERAQLKAETDARLGGLTEQLHQTAQSLLGCTAELHKTIAMNMFLAQRAKAAEREAERLRSAADVSKREAGRAADQAEGALSTHSAAQRDVIEEMQQRIETISTTRGNLTRQLKAAEGANKKLQEAHRELQDANRRLTVEKTILKKDYEKLLEALPCPSTADSAVQTDSAPHRQGAEQKQQGPRAGVTVSAVSRLPGLQDMATPGGRDSGSSPEQSGIRHTLQREDAPAWHEELLPAEGSAAAAAVAAAAAAACCSHGNLGPGPAVPPAGAAVRLSAAGVKRRLEKERGAEWLRPGEVGRVINQGADVDTRRPYLRVRCPRGGKALFWLRELVPAEVADSAVAASVVMAAAGAWRCPSWPSPGTPADAHALPQEPDVLQLVQKIVDVAVRDSREEGMDFSGPHSRDLQIACRSHHFAPRAQGEPELPYGPAARFFDTIAPTGPSYHSYHSYHDFLLRRKYSMLGPMPPVFLSAAQRTSSATQRPTPKAKKNVVRLTVEGRQRAVTLLVDDLCLLGAPPFFELPGQVVGVDGFCGRNITGIWKNMLSPCGPAAGWHCPVAQALNRFATQLLILSLDGEVLCNMLERILTGFGESPTRDALAVVENTGTGSAVVYSSLRDMLCPRTAAVHCTFRDLPEPFQGNVPFTQCICPSPNAASWLWGHETTGFAAPLTSEAAPLTGETARGESDASEGAASGKAAGGRGVVELHPTLRRRRRRRRGNAFGSGAPGSWDRGEKRADATPQRTKPVMRLDPEPPPHRARPRGARAR